MTTHQDLFPEDHLADDAVNCWEGQLKHLREPLKTGGQRDGQTEREMQNFLTQVKL